MHLKGLSGGGAQCAVAIAVGEVIQSCEQVGRNTTTWVAQPQHHLPAAHLVGFAQFAMVLLIAAVEFQQLNRILTETDVVVQQFRLERFAQMTAVKLPFLSF